MEDNNWEEGFREILRDYQPEGLLPDWEAFSNYLNVHEKITEWENDEMFDESLKESISEFNAPPVTEGWDKIESSLNLADQQFDKHIRDKINQFEPGYNPRTWPILLKHLSGVGYLRTKLIAFKVVEVAAVLLILITVLKMGQMGKLPFETDLFALQKEKISGIDITSGADLSKEYDQTSSSNKHSGNTSANSDKNLIASSGYQGSTYAGSDSVNNISSGTLDFSTGYSEKRNNTEERHELSLHPIPHAEVHPVNVGDIQAITSIDIAAIDAGKIKEEEQGRSFFKKLQVANFLATLISPIRWNREKSMPKLAYANNRTKPFTEFGIVSQLDINHLRIPEDRLLTAGRQIYFPQKGIPTASVGGGFTFSINYPKWAMETGMVYNAKNFKPNRNLVVGEQGGFENNGSVTFEAMRLQTVSVPLNVRYRFDNKGAFKIYGLAGFGLNLIAQSDIDISIEYSFPSLAPGSDPNKDPHTGDIIRKTRSISEHFRDGAPFSTKSYLSANAGWGIEYSVSEHSTLFLQSALHYQIPNLKFSDHNGRNIRTFSIQAGVRSPLGN